MRSKVEKPSEAPLKYRRYRREDWPQGHGDWVTEREAWAAAQEPVLIEGTHHDGRRFAYAAGPLGDLTSMIQARREARLTDWAEGYAGQ